MKNINDMLTWEITCKLRDKITSASNNIIFSPYNYCICLAICHELRNQLNNQFPTL